MSSHNYTAVQCTKIHQTFEEGINDLQLCKVARRPLKKNEIRIKVHAASLNYFDLLMLVGKYQHTPKLPFTVGTEASGVVIEVGSEVSQFAVGDEVLAGMALGSVAEEVVALDLQCFKKPPQFSHEQAAAFFVGFVTAYNGLVQRGNLQPGEYLLITGAAGGMGAAAIQLGKLLGAKVIAAASSDDKLQFAKKLGADYIINYSSQDMKDQVSKITNGKMADVIYENVGGDVFDKALRCVGLFGRLLIVGFASGRIPTIPANIPLIKGFSIVGVISGETMRRRPDMAIEMFNKMNEWTTSGQLKPELEHIYDAGNYKEAFRVIAQRKVHGKSIIIFKPQAKL